VYGQKKIRTPNIDRLATEGIRFTNTPGARSARRRVARSSSGCTPGIWPAAASTRAMLLEIASIVWEFSPACWWS
jgi:hypothetical protein